MTTISERGWTRKDIHVFSPLRSRSQIFLADERIPFSLKLRLCVLKRNSPEFRLRTRSFRAKKARKSGDFRYVTATELASEIGSDSCSGTRQSSVYPHAGAEQKRQEVWRLPVHDGKVSGVAFIQRERIHTRAVLPSTSLDRAPLPRIPSCGHSYPLELIPR
jgi:hypothetical protein